MGGVEGDLGGCATRDSGGGCGRIGGRPAGGHVSGVSVCVSGDCVMCEDCAYSSSEGMSVISRDHQVTAEVLPCLLYWTVWFDRCTGEFPQTSQ